MWKNESPELRNKYKEGFKIKLNNWKESFAAMDANQSNNKKKLMNTNQFNNKINRNEDYCRDKYREMSIVKGCRTAEESDLSSNSSEIRGNEEIESDFIASENTTQSDNEAETNDGKEKEDPEDKCMPTAAGGYTHTKASKAKIGAANKGKKPWNYGKNRSEETKARISAGVKAYARTLLPKKLEILGMIEEEWFQKKRRFAVEFRKKMKAERKEKEALMKKEEKQTLDEESGIKSNLILKKKRKRKKKKIFKPEELLEQFKNSNQWDRKKQLIGSAIAVKAVEDAAGSQSLQKLSADGSNGVCQADVTNWISTSEKYSAWMEQMLSKKL